MKQELPLVSVVITTKNEEKNIENCLKSILRQTYPSDRIEILVIDNNSSDKTKEIAKKYTVKVFDKGPERSAQRNFGAKIAQGRYYLYLDADMTLSDGVVKESVDRLTANDSLTALYVPEIIMGNGFWSKARRFERSFYNATVIDAVRFIRREHFLNSDGFNENMIAAEDWDLTKKLRTFGKFDIIKSSLYHNETDFNLHSYLKKKIFYSKDIKNYVAKWGKEDADIKKQLGFYYRFFGVFIENGKWKKLVRHPILLLGIYFLRFLVGLSYLLNKY